MKTVWSQLICNFVLPSCSFKLSSKIVHLRKVISPSVPLHHGLVVVTYHVFRIATSIPVFMYIIN